MDISNILILGLCAGVYSLVMSMNFNSPKPALVISFVCSFLGIVIRDILHSLDLSLALSSFISVFIISVIALYTTRINKIAFITIVSCALPLGAALPFFRMVEGIVKIPTTGKDELSSVVNFTIQNTSEVITIYIAIIWGAFLALSLFRLISKRTYINE